MGSDTEDIEDCKDNLQEIKIDHNNENSDSENPMFKIKFDEVMIKEENDDKKEEESTKETDISDLGLFVETLKDDFKTDTKMIESTNKTNSGKKIYKCSECLFSCTAGQTLSSHMTIVHKLLKRFCCTKCPEKYSKTRDLLAHMRNVHGRISRIKDPKYQCNICNKMLTSRGSYSRHKRNFHPEAMKDFLCRKCDERFTSRNDMMTHVFKAHFNGYQCDQCDFRCYRKRLLSDHINVVHLKCKPHECEKCNTKFSTLGIFQRHMKKSHDIDFFPCTDCNLNYNCKTKYTKHRIDVHGKSKNFQCSECPLKLSTKINLINHLKSFHSF